MPHASTMSAAPRPDTRRPIAVVTGAAGGIGAAVATALVDNGIPTALLDQDQEGVRALAKRLSTATASAWAYPVDVSDGPAIEQTVEQIETEAGPIGRLINVAGVLRPVSVLSADPSDWESSLAVNAGGVFHVCRAVGRRMVERRSGSIVTIGSNAAAVPRIGLGCYAASKAAAIHLTRCLGLELAPYGIRCNIVSPGSTDTAMQQTAWGEDAATSAVAGDPDTFRVGIPLGRIADPTDIADAVLFLTSDRARHITLQELRVDGGATL